MILRIFLAAAVVISPIEIVYSDDIDEDIRILEESFAKAELGIINSIDALPDQARTRLRSVSVSGRIADFGETWNPTDVYMDDDYLVRHIFSGDSDTITAVLYQSGGYRGPVVFLLLMSKDSGWYCQYMLRTRLELTFTMESIQALFHDPAATKPSCNMRPG